MAVWGEKTSALATCTNVGDRTGDFGDRGSLIKEATISTCPLHYMPAHAFIILEMWMYLCMYAYMYVCMYVCMSVCMAVGMYVYVHS